MGNTASRRVKSNTASDSNHSNDGVEIIEADTTGLSGTSQFDTNIDNFDNTTQSDPNSSDPAPAETQTLTPIGELEELSNPSPASTFSLANFMPSFPKFNLNFGAKPTAADSDTSAASSSDTAPAEAQTLTSIGELEELSNPSPASGFSFANFLSSLPKFPSSSANPATPESHGSAASSSDTTPAETQTLTPTGELEAFLTTLYNEIGIPPHPIDDMQLLQRALGLEQNRHFLHAAYAYYAILNTLESSGDHRMSRFAIAGQGLTSIVQNPQFQFLSMPDQNKIYFAIGYGMLKHFHHREVHFADTYLEQIATCFAMSHRLRPNSQTDYVGVLLTHLRDNSSSNIAKHSTALLLLLVEKLLIAARAYDYYRDEVTNRFFLAPLDSINAACAANKTFCEQFARDSDGNPLYDKTVGSLIRVVCTYDREKLLPQPPSSEVFHQHPDRYEPESIYRPANNAAIAPGLRSREEMLATLPEQQIPLAITTANANVLENLLQIWLWRETRTLFVSASSQATHQSIPSISSILLDFEPFNSSAGPSALVEPELQQPAQTSTSSSFFSSFSSRLSRLGSSLVTTPTPAIPETVVPEVLSSMQGQLRDWIQVALNTGEIESAKALYQYLLFITPGNELIGYIQDVHQSTLLQSIHADISTFHTFLSERCETWSQNSVKRAPAEILLLSLSSAIEISPQQNNLPTSEETKRSCLTLWQLIHEFKRDNPEAYQILFERQGPGTVLMGKLSNTAKELERRYETSARGQYASALALMERLQPPVQQNTVTDSLVIGGTTTLSSTAPIPSSSTAAASTSAYSSSITSPTSSSFLGAKQSTTPNASGNQLSAEYNSDEGRKSTSLSLSSSGDD